MITKLITGYIPETFEKNLNNFIQSIGDKKIIDIKYGGAAGVLDSPIIKPRYYSALIIYKE